MPYLTKKKPTFLLVAIILFISLLQGCATKIPTSPCISNVEQLSHCPPKDAIEDPFIAEHQKDREFLTPDQHDQDYLELAMVSDIPIQDAKIKIIGSDYRSAVMSLAIKIWLIENAKYTVDLSYYIFTRDETGYAILGAVCNAVKRGVDIRIMVDSVGSFSLTHKELKSLQTCAREAGFRRNDNGKITTTQASIQSVVFNAVTQSHSRFNRRAHDKLLIVDAAFAKDAWVMTGGRNISNNYYGFDENLKPDLGAFKDAEILLKPLEYQSNQASAAQLMEYYFSIIFSHVGNKKLNSWWQYNGQLEKGQKNLSALKNDPIFSTIYASLENELESSMSIGQVRLAHEIGNLKSNNSVVADYGNNLDANPNSIMGILKSIDEEMPEVTHVKIVSPYLFLEEYLLKAGGTIPQDQNLAKDWLDQDPNRTIEIITNSILTSDNFFTQAVIDMHTGPKLLLRDVPEIEELWLNSDLSKNEHDLEFTQSPVWKQLINNPRIRVYQTGKIDSKRLGGDKYYGKLHAKFILTNEVGFVGTSNFDFRSMLFNSEVGFFLRGDEALAELEQEFQLLKSQSYQWGSPEWFELREAVRKAGGVKGFTTKSQRTIYKILEKTGLKFQF